MDKSFLFFTCSKGFKTQKCCNGKAQCPDLIQITHFTVSDCALWIPTNKNVLRLYVETNSNRLIPIREIIDTFGLEVSNEPRPINDILKILIDNA
jgi:hypothetical protein